MASLALYSLKKSTPTHVRRQTDKGGWIPEYIDVRRPYIYGGESTEDGGEEKTRYFRQLKYPGV